jgi:hypothetical protein
MAKKKLPQWATTVTPFSKYLALSMLVILPVAAFFYGTYFQRQWDLQHNTYTIKVIPRAKPTGSVHQNGQISCNTDADCPPDYVCTQKGPIIYSPNRKPHKTCYKKGSMLPM